MTSCLPSVDDIMKETDVFAVQKPIVLRKSVQKVLKDPMFQLPYNKPTEKTRDI